MQEPLESQLTNLLNRMGEEGESVQSEFVALLCNEMQRLANHQMARQREDHTLQPTALVNEVWLRLSPALGQTNWQDRRHFFRAAAKAMRSVLTDHARRRVAAKRGGGARAVTLDEALVVDSDNAGSVLELDESLERLHAEDPGLAEVVQLRFYAGLSHADIASQLQVTVRTVERRWRAARLWLLDSLGKAGP